MKLDIAYYLSPTGVLKIMCENDFLIYLKKVDEPYQEIALSPLARIVTQQLDDYFAGKRQTFDIPLKLHGTPFQKKDWQTLQTIPYGETRTYKQIAIQMNAPNAYRAVGLANHHNPISIIIPCHRVVGTSGQLVGYAGGLDMKQYLLNLERSAR